MTTMIFNLHEYKKAKTIVADLEKVLQIISRCKNDLKKYGKYNPIREIYSSLLQNQVILEQHLVRYKHTLQQKGSVHEKLEETKKIDPK